MSNGLVIVLIIVVWLFVLAPLVMRNQKPIHKTGEAFQDTRVVYEGGSGKVASRRAPRLGPDDVRRDSSRRDDDLSDDYEVVLAEDDENLLIEESAPADRDEIIEGEVVEAPVEELAEEASEETAGGSTGSTKYSELIEMEEPRTESLAEQAKGGSYRVDDTLVDPADLMHPVAREEAKRTVAPLAEDKPAQHEDVNIDLTDEDVAFARSHEGRGFYDPERDARLKGDRYARRRRTLMGLAVTDVVTLLIAVLAGNGWWVLPIIAIAATALYLVALRQQVKEEQALRARRIRHLRRARMGVRSAEMKETNIPRELRRPGAVVLEVEDGDPDFFDLPEVRLTHVEEENEPPVHINDFRDHKRVS